MRAIGVDVGGSGIRVQTSDTAGIRTSRLVTALPRHSGRIDIPELAEAIVRCVQATQFEPSFEHVTNICIGMSGLPDLLDDPKRLATMVGNRLKASRVILANDAVTTHVGALGFDVGTVVAAGTGTIALGTDFGRRWQRTDGWGLLLGDEGSGAWIGQRGLIAAYRAVDNRAGGSLRLLDLMRAHVGEPETLVSRAYTDPAPAYLFGSFAPHVAEAARSGDDVARAIWDEAGVRIASSALAASISIAPRFSWAGRLFDAGDLLLEPFQRAVREGRPDAVFRSPQGTSTDGAVRLAQNQSAERSIDRSALVMVFEITLARERS